MDVSFEIRQAAQKGCQRQWRRTLWGTLMILSSENEDQEKARLGAPGLGGLNVGLFQQPEGEA